MNEKNVFFAVELLPGRNEGVERRFLVGKKRLTAMVAAKADCCSMGIDNPDARDGECRMDCPNILK